MFGDRYRESFPIFKDALNDTQKKKKVTNLLYEMHKKDQSIRNMGSNQKPKWALCLKNEI